MRPITLKTFRRCTNGVQKPTIHCAVSRGRGILSTIIGATVNAFGKREEDNDRS